jgi:hypothetical protein
MSESWSVKNYVDFGLNIGCVVSFIACFIGIVYMTFRAYQRNPMFANLSNNLVVSFIISTLMGKSHHGHLLNYFIIVRIVFLCMMLDRELHDKDYLPPLRSI